MVTQELLFPTNICRLMKEDFDAGSILARSFMKRASWKGLFVDTSILKHKKIKAPEPIIVPQEDGEVKVTYPPVYVRVRSRISAIPGFYVSKGFQVGIYNGKTYKTLSLEQEKPVEEENDSEKELEAESNLEQKEVEFGKEKYLGYKLGEFSFTRKHSVSSKRKKKEKKKMPAAKTKAKGAKTSKK